MLNVGRGLIALGVAMLAWAFAMNVSVADPTGEFASLANNDLMNQRLLFAITGSAAFIGGWLALLVRAVKDRP